MCLVSNNHTKYYVGIESLPGARLRTNYDVHLRLTSQGRVCFRMYIREGDTARHKTLAGLHIQLSLKMNLILYTHFIKHGLLCITNSGVAISSLNSKVW